MGNKQTELNNSGNQVENVPGQVKTYLTIDEATAYTGIGRDKLYEMTSQEKCPFVLWVGNRRMIKRRVFDEYIEKMYSIQEGGLMDSDVLAYRALLEKR